MVYTETKLGSNFQIKDKTKFNHNHDLVYYVLNNNNECHKNRKGTSR